MRKKFLLLLLLIAGIYSYFLYNIRYYYVPDPDVFEYLAEGKAMLHESFMWVATPPAYSVLLYVFDKTLPIENPGIVGGILFNILCFALSLFILWKLSGKLLGLYIFLPLILFMISPLSFLVNLQPLNISSALLFILLTFFFHHGHPKISYVFMTLAFFCRYEAIVLFPIVVFWDLLERKKLSSPATFLLLCIPVVTWVWGGLNQDTVYTPEIIAGGHKIPNSDFVVNSFSSILFNFTAGSAPIAILVVSWLIVGIFICYKNGIIMPLLFGLFIFAYSLIHTMFPVVVPRYSYLILPFILILFYWPAMFISRLKSSSKTFVIVLLVVLTIYSVHRSVSYRGFQTQPQWSRADKRAEGIWLNKNIIRPTIVYAFMNDVIGYYANNLLIKYPRKYNQQEMNQNICDDNKDIIIFIDNDTTQKKYFYDYADGLDYANVFINSEIFPYFNLLETLHVRDYMIKTYGYRVGMKKNNPDIQKFCAKHQLQETNIRPTRSVNYL